MKRYFSAILILSFTWINAYAQQLSGRREAAAAADNNSPMVSVRAQNMYGNTETNTDNVIWMREIYRNLDLKNEKNGPLYFPVEPVDNRINLFTLIFNVLAEGKVSAYEYLDGREIFTDKYKINFKDILDKYGIYYEAKFSRSSKNPIYEVNESDVPSNEVLDFYIKEMWYFDQANSTFDSKIIALCPLISVTGDFGGEPARSPMFWVTYESIRPYLSQVQVMTSNYNNVTSSTYDDYFRQKLYKGDIYKATNLANLALMQYCQTDSAMHEEQKRIEGEIAAFEKKLWEQPDSVNISALKNKKNLTKAERDLLRKLQADEKPEATAAATEATTAVNTETTSPPNKSVKNSSKSSTKQSSSSSSSKASKPKSAPTKSVRRTR
ncbi:MAG: gliding motility protein GldN [Candidatus Azobacteroides sp.]|nr:gliding motility protein GldN [Candidatus Azobacteroides sp.]